MAFERLSDVKVRGDSLDNFVETRLKMFSTQIAVRNAEDELRFNRAVLENNLTLDAQLEYRQKQISRVSDDPQERRRVSLEISALKDRIEMKKFEDDYTEKLINFESGISSVETVLKFLKDRKNSVTDQNVKNLISKNILEMTEKQFQIQQDIIKNQTEYAVRDKTESVLESQIKRVSKVKNDALLSGNDSLVSIYDLQLQALQQAQTENTINKQLKEFSVSTMTGYSKATDLLDAYNGKISSAGTGKPVTVNGVTYESEQEFWRVRRDSYIADDSGNGFFSRYSDEQKTTLQTAYSSNVLNNEVVQKTASNFNALSSRPELQAFNYKITNAKQDVLQTGADLQATTILSQYAVDSDVNKAVSGLNGLKQLGANIDSALTKVITSAADIKSQQLSGIYQRTSELVEQGVDAEKAIEQAVKEGASLYLSPEQLATKDAEVIAKETAKAQKEKSFTTPDRRTTVTDPKAATGQTPPPVVPDNKNLDVSSKYGKVGAAIYRKSDGKAFTNPTEFFADAGVTSFSGLKFDENYKPPVSDVAPFANESQTKTPAGPTPTAAPAAPQPAKQTTYKVASGDTLTAIAKKYLGDASRYTEIAKANKIKNPNQISVGQQLIIPNK